MRSSPPDPSLRSRFAGDPARAPRNGRAHQPKHAPRVPFALLVTGLIVGGMCALLALNTAAAANQVNRHDLATKDAAIALQLQQLRNEVAASDAPGSLASAAAALGMVPATDPAFLVVGANGSVRLMGSPGPASYAPLPVPPPSKKKPATHASTKPAGKSTSPAGKSTKPAGKSTSPAGKSTSPTQKGTTTRSNAATKPTEPKSTPTPTTTLPGGPR